MKGSKGRIKNSNKTAPYTIAQISTRFMAYITDEVLLISIASLIAAQLGYFPVIFLASFRYLSNEHPILLHSYYNSLYHTILIFILISFIYYFLEVKIGYSLGGLIAGNKLYEVSATRKNHERKFFLYFAIINSLVKSLILFEIINSAFALKEKLSQTYIEKKFSIIMVSKNFSEKRSLKRTILLSVMVYFIPILVISFIAGFYNFYITLPPPSPHTTFSNDPTFKSVKIIFLNNFILDFYYYILGGFVLSFLSIVEVFSNSYFSSLFIGGAIKVYPQFLIFGFLPQFLFEGLSYVIGIASSFLVASMIIEAMKSYFMGEEIETFSNMITHTGIRVMLLAIISISILFISAVIEVFLTSYLLSTYYYIIIYHLQFLI